MRFWICGQPIGQNEICKIKANLLNGINERTFLKANSNPIKANSAALPLRPSARAPMVARDPMNPVA